MLPEVHAVMEHADHLDRVFHEPIEDQVSRFTFIPTLPDRRILCNESQGCVYQFLIAVTLPSSQPLRV